MVGLTGGIGSGKSTVARMLVERGAVVVDADAIALEVVEPGKPALATLAEAFGPESSQPDGALDRPRRERAFVTDETRKQLEAITHPAIGEEFFARSPPRPPDGIVIHDVPLLVESKRGFEYGAVIVVEAPLELRLDGSSTWRAPRRRRAAHRVAGLRRRPPKSGHVDGRQLVGSHRPRAADRRNLARGEKRAAAAAEEEAKKATEKKEDPPETA